MICYTIAQESRRLALADMLNAAALGADLVEVRLDIFQQDPDPKELLNARRKPVIFSCRRPLDGGNWQGSEEDRIKLLKMAIVSNPDYCEIESDIADEIRRFGSCQRVISYTNLTETPSDIADIYEEMRGKDPDIIKLTCKARTPEEAWPLVQILAKPPLPTVVVGLGRPGAMLTILGRRMGAPWTVAALEKGAEAYPGQPTARELEQVYHYRTIDRQTTFVGVTGLGEREFLNTALLNAAFAQAGLPLRCLPLQVGNVKLFRKVMEAVKLLGVVIEEDQQDALREIVAVLDANAEGAILNQGGMPVELAVDLLVKEQDKQWHGASTFTNGAVSMLEATLQANGKTLDGAMVMMAGLDSTARSLARGIKERGGKLIFAGHNRDDGVRFSRQFGGRHVGFEGIYSIMHDVLVVCGLPSRTGKGVDDSDGALHPGYLKAGMTVMDVTGIPRKTPFLSEAQARGCAVVSPRDLLIEQVRAQVKRLTELDVRRTLLEKTLDALIEEE
ncbi:MAG TPA: type I 3-dehydroquinate dehydratase [Gemmataceae bacterium]|jgi:3-dehydroquinate dehydratase/shikimate dehydrogenase|nr:type I 3-dehydroquinate dehydratase [Gemmataceae bacterium]